MKIGIICHPTYGGSGGFATGLAQQLARRGHEIHIISYEVPFKLSQYWPKNLKYHRVDTADYPLFRESPYTISLTNKIAEVVKEEKLDILHSHYAIPHSVAVNMAKGMIRKKIKSLTTIHGTDSTIMGKDNTLKEAVEFALKNDDCITAVSGSLAKETKKNYNLKKQPKVIYNFVATEKTPKSELRNLRKIFAQEKEKILIHVSNFRPVKRISDVLKIFNAVQKKVSSKLILVGDGPEMRKAKSWAKRNKLDSKIHFLGFQLDVPKLLSISDLFLLPSEKEGFNLSALEAMSCGLPIIGSNTLGMNEMVKDNDAGCLSRVGNTKQMTQNAIELLTKKEQWLSCSMNASKAVKEKYSPNIIVPQYEGLYKELLKS